MAQIFFSFHYLDVSIVNEFILYRHFKPQENIKFEALRGRHYQLDCSQWHEKEEKEKSSYG